jgi:hypothetical protein
MCGSSSYAGGDNDAFKMPSRLQELRAASEAEGQSSVHSMIRWTTANVDSSEGFCWTPVNFHSQHRHKQRV